MKCTNVEKQENVKIEVKLAPKCSYLCLFNFSSKVTAYWHNGRGLYNGHKCSKNLQVENSRNFKNICRKR